MSVRDYTLPDVVFTTVDGISFTIKDMREYPTYQLWFQQSVQKNEQLDEIASRGNVYGTDAEFEYYRIFEFNKEKLFDVKFNMDRITSLDIPVL